MGHVFLINWSLGILLEAGVIGANLLEVVVNL